MTIVLEWDNRQQSVVKVTFDERWNWAEAGRTYNQLANMIKDVSHTVDFIVDLTKCPSLPGESISKIRYYTLNTPSNSGLIVLVGANMIIQAVVGVFKRVYYGEGQRYIFAKTLDQARQLLDERRTSV